MIDSSPGLQRIIHFLNDIGLPCMEDDSADGFIPGILIRDGVLHVAGKATVSGLLHEAGHLAVLPPAFRPFAQKNVAGVQRLMMRSIDWSDPDVPLCVAAMQSSDPEATAWAWAAGLELEFRPQQIIEDWEYGGSGADVRNFLRLKSYAGINGLARAGFCKVRGPQGFPQMQTWVSTAV